MAAADPPAVFHKLSFAKDYSSDNFVVLELTEDMFDKSESGDVRLFVRGASEDFAVLCSDTNTYEMKLRESSNTMLLCSNFESAEVDNEAAECQVDGMQHYFLELRQLTPRWNRVKHLMESAPFQGAEYEIAVETEKKYSFGELQSSVQSSQAELLHYLQNIIYACEINGFWRILTHEYVVRLIQQIVTWLQYNSLTWDNIPLTEAEVALADLEPAEVMKNFFWPRFALQSAGPFNTCQLNREAIARAIVSAFLRTGAKIYCDELVRWWQSAIPFDIEFDEKLLGGIAYNDYHDVTPSYCYFPKDDLPTVAETRFMLLFKERSQWARDELVPYIEDIVTEGQTVDKMIQKFAKSFVEEGRTFFVGSSFV
ncbi:hypothetical protein RvY_12954 [Ramazzottius varieornatus]|uniref:Sister chromatid cohesion protein DCC1 n=1 Tax=Ramazzottius varieornatus TaxID=947166 RepID=A0A1D1VL80_RAMVA|nr:hypothetical protein RvY_12954 [Ramazzottius varieornatus]